VRDSLFKTDFGYEKYQRSFWGFFICRKLFATSMISLLSSVALMGSRDFFNPFIYLDQTQKILGVYIKKRICRLHIINQKRVI
jgi:hypothetical protein